MDIQPGMTVRVIKENSEHNGWIGLVRSEHGHNGAFVVFLGNGIYRSYFAEDLSTS